MTVYTKSLAGIASFAGGQNLYPGGSGVVLAITPDTIIAPDDLLSPDGIFDGLYPSPNLYPYGGTILATVNHGVVGVFQPSGVVTPNANSRVRSFAGVLAPTVVFSKVTSRSLTGGLTLAGGLATRASATTAKALFGALQASGQLTVARVLPPPRGGGGYSLPMGEDFFQRYKPTLRRQKMRA